MTTPAPPTKQQLQQITSQIVVARQTMNDVATAFDEAGRVAEEAGLVQLAGRLRAYRSAENAASNDVDEEFADLARMLMGAD